MPAIDTSGPLLATDDLDAVRSSLRAALEHVAYPAPPAELLLTAVDILSANCVRHGAGQRGYHVTVAKDKAVSVVIRQDNRFTRSGAFPHASERAGRHPGLDRVDALLRDRATCIADGGGTQMTITIHGGKRLWTLQRLHDWANDHDGYAPRCTDWQPGGHPDWVSRRGPSARCVYVWFKSWGRALAAAALEPRPSALCKWTEEEVLGLLRAWAVAHGDLGPRSTDWTPAARHPDWNPRDWPQASYVHRMLDGWPTALDRAGVRARPDRRRNGESDTV